MKTNNNTNITYCTNKKIKYSEKLKDWVEIRIKAFKYSRKYRKEVFIKILCPLILVKEAILMNLVPIQIKEKWKMNNKNNNSSGLDVLGVLQIVFLVLKLTGLITWSWVLVLIPLWISLGILALVVVAVIIAVCLEQLKRK